MTAIGAPVPSSCPHQGDYHYYRDRHYYRDGAEALCIRPLDGLSLLFHRPSGITHIVDNPVPEILGVLTDTPQSLTQIWSSLQGLYDLEEQEGDALVLLAGHLDYLCHLGLVRRNKAEQCATA